MFLILAWRLWEKNVLERLSQIQFSGIQGNAWRSAHLWKLTSASPLLWNCSRQKLVEHCPFTNAKSKWESQSGAESRSESLRGKKHYISGRHQDCSVVKRQHIALCVENFKTWHILQKCQEKMGKNCSKVTPQFTILWPMVSDHIASSIKDPDSFDLQCTLSLPLPKTTSWKGICYFVANPNLLDLKH